MTENLPNRCWIYGSSRQPEMYLYLREEDAFNLLPDGLMERFGRATLIMELELHGDRQLARADVAEVRSSLKQQGFYLQMPPNIEVELYDAEI